MSVLVDEFDPDGKFKSGLPGESTAAIQEQYVHYCLAVYRKRKDIWVNDLLKEYFKEDFQKFTAIMFQNLPQHLRRDIRDHLRSHGVYVPISTALNIAYALDRVRREDLQWPTNTTGGVVAENTSSGPIETTPVGLETSSGEALRAAVGNASGMTHFTTASATTFRSSFAISSIIKVYTHESQKYSGGLKDNLEKKVKIFSERCEQCGVSDEEKPRAFSVMLTGVALEYYFTNAKGVITDFDGMVGKVKSRFLTKERTLAMTQELESTSLVRYISEKAPLSKKECLNKMVSCFQELQMCLPKDYRSDFILKNKLLSACSNVEQCRLARQKVAPTVEGVIADLHTPISISTLTNSEGKLESLPTAMYTTRKRHHRNVHKGRSGKTCYVCGRSNCWSTNYTTEGKQAALQKNRSSAGLTLQIAVFKPLNRKMIWSPMRLLSTLLTVFLRLMRMSN